MNPKICSYDGCGRRAVSGARKGKPLCDGHRKQEDRHGFLGAIRDLPGGSTKVRFNCDNRIYHLLRETAAKRGIKSERGAWEMAAHEWILVQAAKRFTG